MRKTLGILTLMVFVGSFISCGGIYFYHSPRLQPGQAANIASETGELQPNDCVLFKINVKARDDSGIDPVEETFMTTVFGALYFPIFVAKWAKSDGTPQKPSNTEWKYRSGKIRMIFEDGTVEIEDLGSDNIYYRNSNEISPEVNCKNGICRDDYVLFDTQRGWWRTDKVARIFANGIVEIYGGDCYIYWRPTEQLTKAIKYAKT